MGRHVSRHYEPPVRELLDVRVAARRRSRRTPRLRDALWRVPSDMWATMQERLEVSPLTETDRPMFWSVWMTLSSLTRAPNSSDDAHVRRLREDVKTMAALATIIVMIL